MIVRLLINNHNINLCKKINNQGFVIDGRDIDQLFLKADETIYRCKTRNKSKEDINS